MGGTEEEGKRREGGGGGARDVKKFGGTEGRWRERHKRGVRERERVRLILFVVKVKLTFLPCKDGRWGERVRE